ncbi:hypothetical protein LLG39_14170, partial [bacterium]|nr:hypothetical protein [bacterium]
MPDSKRIDLSTNLDEIGEDLLKHVRAATEEVKHRQAADQAKEARSIQREKSKKTSFSLIAVGAVVVLLLSYWVVFARPSTSQGGAINAIPQAKSANVTIKPPVVTST